MTAGAASTGADRGQRRASYQQARSRETKRVLIQAALSLWRANGYATTTVADICRAAGVSKGLFYFYFPRKEDILYEVSRHSSEAARNTARELTHGQYEVLAVVTATLNNLERSMRRNPPELILEMVMEGYRYAYRAITGAAPPDRAMLIFDELFERAVASGELPPHVDAARLARLAQSLISEGARHWAAGAYQDRSFTEVVSADIAVLIAGFRQPPPPGAG
ncbi:TetR/AcrR family transcriptional regulator [Frankia sp. Cpl3]|nr:TetR/AcrR family transcriptional regulator [Frankia sp. Cpl3]